MRLKIRLKQFSFIFTMLVVMLTLFCINTKIVKADDYVDESILQWVSRTGNTYESNGKGLGYIGNKLLILNETYEKYMACYSCISLAEESIKRL